VIRRLTAECAGTFWLVFIGCGVSVLGTVEFAPDARVLEQALAFGLSVTTASYVFRSISGGHFNPGNEHHGIMSGPGHAGDMPNLHVPANGALDLEVLNTSINLDKDNPNSVFHPGGTAIVIHAGKDDYTSDPAGKAGDRIICGVIGE